MKEMYDEIAQLLGNIGKALDLPDDQVAKAVEDGSVALQMAMDERGQRYVRATHAGRSARLYPGAILHEEPKPEEPDEGCGGGCSCGR